MKLINAVAFAVHLKSTAEFSDAMDSAAIYDADPNQPPPPRDRSKDVSDRHLRRKKEHLDVVGMLLQRRTFHSEVASDTVDCLNVYSDASPVVGKEIQGMVVDFTHKDGSVRRVVLPGASLAYGNYDATNKTICLIHALWLICGPDAFHLRRACELVTSLTTDFGVEMNIANVPDCIDAYLEFMDGAELSTLRSKVKFGRQSFPNALRIAGWNHTISSIMKTVMKSCEQYPEHLASMRTMCAFFNCVAYRDHLAKVLAPKVPNAAKLLKSVSASFAKWRYETLILVGNSLLPLRELCEKYLREELFQNVQDREQLQCVVNICRNREFWKWLSAVHTHVLLPLEELRRWGMCCPHKKCLEKRLDGQKHVLCDRNSRRLPQAWTEVEKLIANYKTWSKKLDPSRLR